MLVLSRRPDEKIVFPDLGVTVQIVGVKGGAVRLGIDAPRDVSILRAELAVAGGAVPPKRRHSLLNRLNKIGLALHLARRQLEAGQNARAVTTLEAVLPVLKELEHELADRPAARPKPAAARALLVEDDANERELLAGLLRLHGVDCDTAANGHDALSYLSQHGRPDVVLLDMWMPECDGPQTLRQIRGDERLRDLKVFAVSGTAPQDVGLEVGPGGLDAWFPKPLNLSSLWEAIRRETASGSQTN